MALPFLPLDSKISDALESLFDLGLAACAAIRDFQPDLVIGLAHSGWVPVPVARALWQTAESQPFPPCAGLLGSATTAPITTMPSVLPLCWYGSRTS